MRKKLVVLAMVALVALVALVAVTPALAAGNGDGDRGNGGSHHQQFFSVLGPIFAIDGNTITVTVVDGSWAVRAAGYDVDDRLTVNVTDTTAYYEWTLDGRVPITYGQVIVGYTTNIHGTVTDGVFTADRVTVECP